MGSVKSPDPQAKKMKILFEIKEKIPEIVHELLHSDKWTALIKEKTESQTKLLISNRNMDMEYPVEIYNNELRITTRWPHYIYRIYNSGENTWCEYNGSYHSLLKQKMLPRITPCEETLMPSNPENGENRKSKTKKTTSNTRGFWNENIKNYSNMVLNPSTHKVYDEFIKEDIVIEIDNNFKH